MIDALTGGGDRPLRHGSLGRLRAASEQATLEVAPGDGAARVCAGRPGEVGDDTGG